MTLGMKKVAERFSHVLPHALSCASIMKVVALLSGGKDSCYNLLHCVHNGHTIVAAATLSPPSGKGLDTRNQHAC